MADKPDEPAFSGKSGDYPEGVTMTVHVKLTRDLYKRVYDDLVRPHEFAFERVDFLSARLGNLAGSHLLVLLTDYHPVLDDEYIPDPSCGARINSVAIRTAMQRVLDSRSGAFHVHMHAHRGRPGFSKLDGDEIPRVVAGLRNAGPGLAHGMLLFSDNHGVANVWVPGSLEPIKASRISVVGYPLESFHANDSV